MRALTPLHLTEEARRPFVEAADTIAGSLLYFDEGTPWAQLGHGLCVMACSIRFLWCFQLLQRSAGVNCCCEYRRGGGGALCSGAAAAVGPRRSRSVLARDGFTRGTLHSLWPRFWFIKMYKPLRVVCNKPDGATTPSYPPLHCYFRVRLVRMRRSDDAWQDDRLPPSDTTGKRLLFKFKKTAFVAVLNY